MTNKPRILLIVEEPKTRKYLKRVLTRNGFSCLIALNSAQGIALASSKQPQLILIDFGLPHIDGLRVTKRIRENSDVPIIVLSGSATETHKICVLDAGADGYLTKPFGENELIARLHVALRRTQNIFFQSVRNKESVLSLKGLSVNLSTQQVFMNEREISLSPTEYRLLTALLRNDGNAVSYDQLVREITVGYISDAPAYLRVYVMKLRKKLELSPAEPQLLISVPGYGFRLLS